MGAKPCSEVCEPNRLSLPRLHHLRLPLPPQLSQLLGPHKICNRLDISQLTNEKLEPHLSALRCELHVKPADRGRFRISHRQRLHSPRTIKSQLFVPRISRQTTSQPVGFSVPLYSLQSRRFPNQFSQQNCARAILSSSSSSNYPTKMNSNYPAAYMTSGNGAPTMDIPEHVDGIIDLKTLEAIHQQLNESSDGDDQDLAIWIKEHYLYEPITQPGRQIRTSKGFAQLDRAFRRVRTLTGKAQDKWPFFDRNWKEMPSSMVRNNARGEASPGVRFPSMLRPMRGPSMTNGHNAHLGESSANTHERQFQFQGGPSPQSFVSFGSRAPIRHKNQRQQVFSLPIPNTSVPLPSNNKVPSKLCPDSDKTSAPQEVPAPEKQAQQDPRSTDDLPKYTGERKPPGFSTSSTQPESLPSSLFADQKVADFFLRSEGPSSARSTSAPEERPEEVKVSSEGPADTPMPQNDEVAQMNADEVAREADNGKVRGPDGRYLTKPNSTPRKARRSTGGRRKSGRKCRRVKNSLCIECVTNGI